jgi:cell shape-determining protein MreC
MIITMLEKLEKEMVEIKLRLAELEHLKKENEYLRELVQHLASRPASYQPDPYAPPYKVTC